MGAVYSAGGTRQKVSRGTFQPLILPPPPFHGVRYELWNGLSGEVFTIQTVPRKMLTGGGQFKILHRVYLATDDRSEPYSVIPGIHAKSDDPMSVIPGIHAKSVDPESVISGIYANTGDPKSVIPGIYGKKC